MFTTNPSLLLKPIIDRLEINLMCGCVDILQDLMCGCVDMLQDLMCGWPYCRIIICTFEGTFERRYYEGMLYSEFQPACLGRGNKFAKFTGW